MGNSPKTPTFPPSSNTIKYITPTTDMQYIAKSYIYIVQNNRSESNMDSHKVLSNEKKDLLFLTRYGCPSKTIEKGAMANKQENLT